jgi:hypothetical protein
MDDGPMGGAASGTVGLKIGDVDSDGYEWKRATVARTANQLTADTFIF